MSYCAALKSEASTVMASFKEFAARHRIDQLAVAAIGAAWLELGILRQKVLFQRFR
jgi:hypothetical protein